MKVTLCYLDLGFIFHKIKTQRETDQFQRWKQIHAHTDEHWHAALLMDISPWSQLGVHMLVMP